MPSLFDWLDSINTDKKLELDEDNPYKEYVPFQINTGMSQFLDTVLLANEMNKRPWLSKEMQHKFYRGVVTKKKRMGKWAKVEEVNKEDIELVCDYYKVNKHRAAEYLKLVSPQELEIMRKATNKGGAEAGRGKRK